MMPAAAMMDAAPRIADIANGADEVVHVRRVHFNIDTVDIGKAFEQDRLALHHGF